MNISNPSISALPLWQQAYQSGQQFCYANNLAGSSGTLAVFELYNPSNSGITAYVYSYEATSTVIISVTALLDATDALGLSSHGQNLTNPTKASICTAGFENNNISVISPLILAESHIAVNTPYQKTEQYIPVSPGYGFYLYGNPTTGNTFYFNVLWYES